MSLLYVGYYSCCYVTHWEATLFQQEYLQKEDPGLRQVIAECGGRYHFINNRQRQNREQVRQLLEKVRSCYCRIIIIIISIVVVIIIIITSSAI